MEGRFNLQGKLVVLRLNRLDYVPSGLYSSELLAEQQLPVIAIEYGFFRSHLEKEDCKIPRLRLGHPWLRKLPRKLRGLAVHLVALVRIGMRILSEGRPRLILAEGLHEQTLAWILKCLFRIPYVVHVHEVYQSGELTGWNRMFFTLEGAALRGARFTVFPEATRASIYRQRYGLTEAQYIAFNCPRKNESICPTDWRTRLALEPDARLLGYFGGQGRSNALEQGIRAVARLSKVYFLLWGWSSHSDREYFKRVAVGVGAGDRVLFLGELPTDKWSAIAGLDVSYCMYEPRELRLRHLATASNKLMESLAAGVPVLTSNTSDFRNIVQTHDVGLCAPDFTVEGISSTLQELILDEEGLARRSENALRCHRNYFHYEYQYQPVLRALRDKVWYSHGSDRKLPLTNLGTGSAA